MIEAIDNEMETADTKEKVDETKEKIDKAEDEILPAGTKEHMAEKEVIQPDVPPTAVSKPNPVHEDSYKVEKGGCSCCIC